MERRVEHMQAGEMGQDPVPLRYLPRAADEQPVCQLHDVLRRHHRYCTWTAVTTSCWSCIEPKAAGCGTACLGRTALCTEAMLLRPLSRAYWNANSATRRLAARVMTCGREKHRNQESNTCLIMQLPSHALVGHESWSAQLPAAMWQRR